ncbi:hypothetical protein [Rhodococcoides fascians]|uniref:hypothetical protein n=1 Tax=Rhodococcoides fascians TaxID=1828 RepID=UPI0005667F62|nr:hypothetical protein [Rhodococcus fascians]
MASGKKRVGAKTRPAVVAKFPRHTLVQALRIPEAIYKQNGGNPATTKEAVTFAGGRSVTGAYQLEISSAKKYGFLKLEGGKLALEERARRAIAPQSEGDKVAAFREAVLAAPEISDVYNFYRGENLPDSNFLVNALTDKFGIPADKTAEFLSILTDSLEQAELVDSSGDRPRLRDIGRDERHQFSSAETPNRPLGSPVVKGQGTCFVMQPFQAPLGGYYESIFLPAIEQTGLSAVRADADIFGTGKIIDQIWRGIRGATVLIAELTTKNPNVFYELGLAHALQKPVILVSSNQDDVPFDLRHIRVILYDKSDPFWGTKLIDKVADNVRSAMHDPEDAIFRIEDVR